MTNLEALQSIIGINYPFDPNMYQKALIDANLDPTLTYISANGQAIDLCVVGLILTIIASPDVKEGGYTITVADRQALLTLRATLLAKYGISSGTGFIKDASNIW